VKHRCKDCEHRSAEFARYLVSAPPCYKGKNNPDGRCKTFSQKVCRFCGYRLVTKDQSFCSECDGLVGLIT
jgi:hypothetical protein